MALLNADADTIRANLTLIERDIAESCARAGRNPDAVRICVATKYVDDSGMQSLLDAGVKVAAENRLQDMIAKQERFREDFDWHFIGGIQSRKIKEIAERVSTIHSLSSESARDKLAGIENPPRVLVQVNVSGEESKQGIAPEDLAEFIAATPVPVCGLMTMPPLAASPEDAKPYFARLKQLADQHGLAELSMGTSQDFTVAVEEGATMIRLGSVLFAPQTN